VCVGVVELFTSSFVTVYEFNSSHIYYLKFLDSSRDKIGLIYKNQFVLDTRFSSSLKVEAAGCFETLVLTYHKTVSYPRTCCHGIAAYLLNTCFKKK
jgi:hypothetical protein